MPPGNQALSWAFDQGANSSRCDKAHWPASTAFDRLSAPADSMRDHRAPTRAAVQARDHGPPPSIPQFNPTNVQHSVLETPSDPHPMHIGKDPLTGV
jgi:hypothetical protein